MRARTVLDNPGQVPARLLSKTLVARGEHPGATPPKTLHSPPVGGVFPHGTFVEVDHTLEIRRELVHQNIGVLEPFDGWRTSPSSWSGGGSTPC